MAGSFAQLISSGERRMVAWAAASATFAVLLTSLLKRLPWAWSSGDSGFAAPNTLIILAIAVFAASFALTWAAIRLLRAPVWIWLGPAVAALWALLYPLVLVLGFGWDQALERLAVSGLWNATAPAVTIALPAMRAARVASSEGSLLPAGERGRALRFAAFGLAMLVINGVAAEIVNGGFSALLGPLRDDQAIVAAFVFDLIAPFVAALLFTSLRIVPASSWTIVAGPAVAYFLATLPGSTGGDALVYAWFLAPLVATVTAGCLLGGLIASRFRKAEKVPG